MRLFATIVVACLTCATSSVSSQTARTGPVRLDGARFADDGGAWPALGASLFWALWGEKNAPKRLDQNLAFLAKHGVDYVRVLSMVGTKTWADRVIDPKWPDYWDVVDRLVARAARHGLRLQVTVFADAQVMMPDASDRETWADQWARRAARNPERFMFLEVANEYWQNGFWEAPQQVGALGTRINTLTEVLVSASAPQCAYPPAVRTDADRACVAEWRALQADGTLDLATPHFGRGIDGPLGRRGPGCEALSMRHVPRELVKAWVSNEPIGPQSSVEAETDPKMLAHAARVTWAAGGAGYVLHSGAGIRGGGAYDKGIGRAANLWDVPNVIEVMKELQNARRGVKLSATTPAVSGC